MQRARRILIAAIVALGTWSRAAMAHPTGLSQGEYAYEEGKVFAGITFARRELAAALPWMRGDDGLVAFERKREPLGQWVLDHLTVAADDAPCAGAFDGMRFDGDGVALALSFACPKGARLDIDARFASDLERGHRHLAALTAGDERREAVATETRTRVSFAVGGGEPRPTQSPAPGVFASLARMGIEHILTGYDHLLFLVGLVLVWGPIRSLIAAVTAFTVAHSITLAVAALGIWMPSPRLIEPCIALSIAYVGVENWFVRDARGRWRVTFPFGLVHGFAFAGALREVAIPRAELPGALFAFNAGVEVGQMMVLGVVFPLVFFARKRALWDRVGMRACTMGVALAGVAWFIVRVSSSI